MITMFKLTHTRGKDEVPIHAESERVIASGNTFHSLFGTIPFIISV